MLNFINIQQIKENISFSDGVEKTKQFLSHWHGKTVLWLNELPSRMQKDANEAAAVFVAANLALAFFSEKFIKKLDSYLERHPEELQKDEKAFKNRFFTVIFAGCIYGGNKAISHLTHYSLSPRVLAAITVGMTFFRYIVQSYGQAPTPVSTGPSPHKTEHQGTPRSRSRSASHDSCSSIASGEAKEEEREESSSRSRSRSASHESFLSDATTVKAEGKEEGDDVFPFAAPMLPFNKREKPRSDISLEYSTLIRETEKILESTTQLTPKAIEALFNQSLTSEKGEEENEENEKKT